MTYVHPDSNTVPSTYLSWEKWNDIQLCKKRFFEEPFNFSENCSVVDSKVIDSWKRCWDMELDPRLNVYANRLDHEAYEQVLRQHEDVVAVCRPLFDELNETTYDCHFSLINLNGVVLMQTGNYATKLRIEEVGACGLIWSEETVGTTSHALAIRHKRPIQLLGSEYYSNAFKTILCSSAAPIYDDKNQMEAVLTMVYRQDKAKFVGSELEKDLLSNAMTIITALANTISSQLKLRRSNQYLMQLNGSYNILNQKLQESLAIQTATMSGINHNIITVDKNGTLIQCNRAASDFLKIDESRVKEYSIKNFLAENSKLLDAINIGNTDQIEELLVINGEKILCLIDVWPIKPAAEQANVLDGKAVLRIQTTEQFLSKVSQKSGSIARCHFSDIIGNSPAIQNSITIAKQFAQSKENILLTGQSGTGKEMFAQSIHNFENPSGPFIVLNCAAIPRNLIESELFGYEAGSFTGADKKGRPGKIELANGGTLFLDEIGDMPFEIQVVLLRVLQDKQVMRIGGTHQKKVDFRVIAATNKDLPKMVEQGLFRADLFFRLSVLCVHLPPLREREGDAELFAEQFIQRYCARMGWKIPKLTLEARHYIRNNPWPGNMRQLENTLIFAVNSCRGNDIQLQHFKGAGFFINESHSLEELKDQAPKATKVMSLSECEQQAIRAALQKTDNHIPQAAAILKISKSTLYRKMREYGMLN